MHLSSSLRAESRVNHLISRTTGRTRVYHGAVGDREQASIFFRPLARPLEYMPITLVNDTLTRALQKPVTRSPGVGDTTAEITGAADREGNER